MVLKLLTDIRKRNDTNNAKNNHLKSKLKFLLVDLIHATQLNFLGIEYKYEYKCNMKNAE